MTVRVKICGVTVADDVRLCGDAGADAVGINFAPASSRYVEPSAAAPLVRAASPLMSTVGVFVGRPLRQVCAIAFQLGLRGVQSYGDFGDAFPFGLIAAFRVGDAAHLAAIDAYLAAANPLPSAILVDAFVEGYMGGTGHVAPWGLLADYRPVVPLILAGGLTPDNVAEAIRVVRPAGVDVASGVETSPGRKDPEKVKRFVAAVREASRWSPFTKSD